MALPKYVALGHVSGGGFDLTGTNSNEIVEASQTDNSVVALGNGNDTLFAGDVDSSFLGNGTDTYYGARDSNVTAGSGVDTFIYGVSTKPQTIAALGVQTILNYDTSKDTVQLAKNLVSAQQLIQDFSHATHYAATGTSGGEWYIPLDNEHGIDIVSKIGSDPSKKELQKTFSLV